MSFSVKGQMLLQGKESALVFFPSVGLSSKYTKASTISPSERLFLEIIWAILIIRRKHIISKFLIEMAFYIFFSEA